MRFYPDSDGVMYSGSGIVMNRDFWASLRMLISIFIHVREINQNGAWENLNQRIAYSTDGKYLISWKETTVKHISGENRDPKVYWHEESKAYIMVCI